MPGLVEKMLVKEGQAVSAGDVLCTVSAMKMEVKLHQQPPYNPFFLFLFDSLIPMCVYIV